MGPVVSSRSWNHSFLRAIVAKLIDCNINIKKFQLEFPMKTSLLPP